MSEMPAVTNEADADIRPITVPEYFRMVETGIIDADEHVELLDGLLLKMSSVGARHLYVVSRLTKLCNAQLGDRGLVVTQTNFDLDAISEPEPDVAIYRGPDEQYATTLPAAADALLLVEVAETSLAMDTGRKLRAYARNGIADYWVVDLAHDRVLVFRDPAGAAYTTRLEVRRGGHVTPLAFPDVTFSLDEFLPPASGR